MEVPLKSKPKVSVASPLDPLVFLNHEGDLRRSVNEQTVPRTLAPDNSALHSGAMDLPKLSRTYSENEKNNFDEETGHRLFNDGRHRASRAASPARRRYSTDQTTSGELYSRSHYDSTNNGFRGFKGMEDEYIPGFDFMEVINQWNRPLSEDSGANSRDALYLDLNTLHARVAPQPIALRPQMRTKEPNFSNSTESPLPKKLKGSPKDAAPVSFEAVLECLPANFNEFPYSQRKKLVKGISESIDYSQFSLYAKSVSSGGLGNRTLRSNPTSFTRNSSFIRRSRRNSANTVAGRLLALSLSIDLRKLDKVPEPNVDEKGSVVMEHMLGKVIGFGAWGIIRECTSKLGDIKAVKIVKSIKDSEKSEKSHNPKILQIFKQEIEIWKQLRHPNILPLLDSLETKDTIFCLTNKINGGTLFELVSRWGIFNEGIESTTGPLNFDLEIQRVRLKTTVECVKQIVEALNYMHEELGIVHGDLKLENVLVDDLRPDHIFMVLCDFGMSRVFRPRISRTLSRRGEGDFSVRSKSSFASTRRPLDGPDTKNTKALFRDDSKIETSHLLYKRGSPVFSLSRTSSGSSLCNFHEFNSKDTNLAAQAETDLPHLHIGLLPYASPELLLPLPPPLGPSADIWALGILIYTMVTGRLPFQHSYEPRLRAMIAAGKYNTLDLLRATLTEFVTSTETPSSSFEDMSRKSQIEELKKKWLNYNREEYAWLNQVVESCLRKDITRRWDLHTVTSWFLEYENVVDTS